MADHLLSVEEFRNFFRYYKGTPEQINALNHLYVAINEADQCLLHDGAEWIRLYREKPKAGPVSNTWDGIKEAARIAGAKFPECVAAQWALESAYGKHTSGKNNFFGIKGRGTSCTTWEDYGHGAVTVKDEFRDFASIQECINWLVDRWYKDYRGYRGVNRAATREDCARLLKAEGYATDPVYSQKLINLMNAHA
jgi:uncharacterized FlgJ-related protein